MRYRKPRHETIARADGVLTRQTDVEDTRRSAKSGAPQAGVGEVYIPAKSAARKFGEGLVKVLTIGLAALAGVLAAVAMGFLL